MKLIKTRYVIVRNLRFVYQVKQSESFLCMLCLYAACSSDEFQCKNSRDCIPVTWVCDEENDCEDSSDEQNCRELLFHWFTYIIIN